MTTEQEWTNDKNMPTQRSAGDVEKWHRSGEVWSIAPRNVSTACAWVAFDPSPAEARAVLRMPQRFFDDPYTREAVHAHIREHGTVEECEAAFRDAVDEHGSTVCPGCGKYAWSEECDDERVAWHEACLARVRSRTEAARSGGPVRVGDRVAHVRLGCAGRVVALNRHSDKADYAKVKWDDGCPSTEPLENLARVAPAPVQPVEPRLFRVGDRVMAKHDEGVIAAVDDADTEYPYLVRFEEGDGEWYRSNELTLVTHAPEEPAPYDGVMCSAHGGLGATWLGCGPCERHEAPHSKPEPTSAPCPRCGAVVTAETVHYWPGNDGSWCCKACHDADPRAITPYVHEGAVVTNPAGFPALRRPELRECPTCGYSYATATECDGCVALGLHEAGTASVVLPFDAFMQAREQQGPEPYDPREGDEVEVSPPGCPPYAAVVAGVDSKWGVRVWCSDGLARVTDVQWCRLVRRGGVR